MNHTLTVALLVALLGAEGPRAPDPAKTDWLVARKYGVFVHYLYGLQNNPEHVASLGRHTSWDECVREFEVERFATRMQEAGAGYVIFTMMQRSRFLIAPNATFDRLTGYMPGEACATRDLVEDLYQALSKRGIDLMLYWTGDGPCDDPKAATALGWPGDGRVTEEFVRNWASVVREYGLRYKDKVKGFCTLTINSQVPGPTTIRCWQTTIVALRHLATPSRCASRIPAQRLLWPSLLPEPLTTARCIAGIIFSCRPEAIFRCSRTGVAA